MPGLCTDLCVDAGAADDGAAGLGGWWAGRAAADHAAGENAKFPLLASFTKPAVLAFEAQLVAYCQLCFARAQIIRNGQRNEATGKALHTKVTTRAMAMGVASANDMVAAHAAFGTGSLAPLAPPPSRKRAKP